MHSYIISIFVCLALLAAGVFYFRQNQESAQAPENAAVSEIKHDINSSANNPAVEGDFVITVAEQVARRLEVINENMQLLTKSLELCAKIGCPVNLSPAAPGSLPAGSEENRQNVIQGKVEKGETIADLFDEADNGRHYVNAAARVFPLRSFRAGQPYAIFRNPETGRIRRFEYELNSQRRLVVEGDDKPRARLEDIEYETKLDLCEGTIDESLFQAVADIGERPQLALKLVDLFGSEINFIRDIQEGDSFSVLLEKRFRKGEASGYGRILAARFTNRGKTWDAWLYRNAMGELQHYNSKGENLKKTLLMAPLAVTRLTSRFTHARKHPILGKTRPHLGVDYGAPTGTPVKAVGNGIVTKRGWAGGYGNQIILKHEAGLESMYAHLSGFARGIKTGQRVRQGQVIGFVGSTGLSTGPHLDFRLRQNGDFINPTKAINPRGAPVPPEMMSSFRRVMTLAKEYMDGKPLPLEYALDSILPAAVSYAKAASQKSGKRKSVQKIARKGKSGKITRSRRNAVSSKANSVKKAKRKKQRRR